MEKQRSPWTEAVLYGLLAGAVMLYFALVGIVKTFNDRAVVEVLSLGHVTLLLSLALVVYAFLRKHKDEERSVLVMQAALIGAVGAFLLALLPFLGQWINFRYMFVQASPELYNLLRFGQPPMVGLIVLVVLGAVVGALLALVDFLPGFWRDAFLRSVTIMLVVGMLSDLFKGMNIHWLFDPFLGSKGLNYLGAVLVFLVGLGYAWFSERRKQMAAEIETELVEERVNATVKRWAVAAFFVVLLLALPAIVGSYLSHVFNQVGLYIIMGLGLNIVVGYAGLLDLGYVAFFALGAYTMGVLTSTGPLGIAHWSFWEALPVAILVALTAGILLGVPVLRMRGDYLAIVTLGFGEIIRVLAKSDVLKPFIGGAQGILNIVKPTIAWGGKTLLEFKTPIHFYYLILIGIVVAFFVAYRLRESRLGRAWMAMREDEDVAEAMGIDLVAIKLTAFGFGAAFSGLAGAIFASYVGSIFPESFNLLISINVLSLIIVGGIGSLPGVVVGSLALVGLPELLREFAEYRMLMYGLALIAMMLLKPEGFWPESIRQRELAVEESGD